MKIRKGDTVEVVAGNHKGARGEVQRVVRGKFKLGHHKGEPDSNHDRLVVAGINIIKKHQRANPQNNRGGGIIDREAFISISNVQLIDPQTGNPTRVKYQIADDGSKTRVATKSGHALDKA